MNIINELKKFLKKNGVNLRYEKIKAKIINLECNNIFSLSEACKKAGYKTSIINSYNKKSPTILIFYFYQELVHLIKP